MSASLLRQVQPVVQLAQLLLRPMRQRAHHQVLGPLVHRNKHDLTQLLLAREQHTLQVVVLLTMEIGLGRGLAPTNHPSGRASQTNLAVDDQTTL